MDKIIKEYKIQLIETITDRCQLEATLEYIDLVSGYSLHETDYRIVNAIDGLKSRLEELKEPILLNEKIHKLLGGVGIYPDMAYYKKSILGAHVAFIFANSKVYVNIYKKHEHTPTDDDIRIIIWDEQIMMRGMYLHEFQNIYMSFTGEKLFARIYHDSIS